MSLMNLNLETLIKSSVEFSKSAQKTVTETLQKYEALKAVALGMEMALAFAAIGIITVCVAIASLYLYVFLVSMVS